MNASYDDRVIAWLTGEDQPAVRYRAMVDLLDRNPGDVEARRTAQRISEVGWAFEILARQRPTGHWASKRSLYRPKYIATNWMMLVLSDLGLTKVNSQVRMAAELFFKDWLQVAEENIFKDEVCVVGNTARMLTRLDYGSDPRVRKLFDRLLEDQKDDGGWHCWEPKGTLDCWEALAAFAALPESQRTRKIKRSIERGAEFYLRRKLLEEGGARYPPWYRLHYPIHYYYDVLVGLDVITRLGYGGDKRLDPALKVLEDKRRSDGTWLLERIHPDPASYAWGKGNLRRKVTPFALEEAGKPSKWITLTSLQVLKRVKEAR